MTRADCKPFNPKFVEKVVCRTKVVNRTVRAHSNEITIRPEFNISNVFVIINLKEKIFIDEKSSPNFFVFNFAGWSKNVQEIWYSVSANVSVRKGKFLRFGSWEKIWYVWCWRYENMEKSKYQQFFWTMSASGLRFNIKFEVLNVNYTPLI